MTADANRPTGQPDPADLLATAIAVVRPAAEQVRQLRVAAVGEVSTKSTDTDVVTAADRAVEQQLVAALRERRPYDVVLGEEYGQATADDRTRARPDGETVRWLLDPIDGTVNYLYGIPFYAVSVAAEVDGRVVAGVVHNAATGAEWTAVVGQGARRDGVRCSGSSETRLSHALVATGFGYAAQQRARQATVVAELIAEVRDIRRLGAASLDLCLAADGVVDGYFEQGLHPWDRAAGELVAAEAGLVVGGLAGAAPGEDMVVVAPPALFGPLHDRLVALGADRAGAG